MKLYLALIFFVGSTVSYGQQLPLSQYLEEVKQAHSGYKGAVEKSKGSAGRSDEGALLYSPNAFAETKYADDQRVTSSPVSQGLESKSQSLSVGVSKQTSFGMQSKLYYAVQNMSLDGPQSTALPDKKFYDSSLNLEVSQPLWKNGFGEDLKAQEKQIALSAKASSMGEQFAAKQILIMAEKAYWRLAIAEEQLKVQNQSYDRAKKITNSQEDRSKRNLIDNSDLLQARAALKMRELDLKAATNESRLALKAFNDLRGQPSGQIAQLDQPVLANLLASSAPQKQFERDDLKAARFGLEAAQSNVELAKNKYKPTLDLFGNASLTGRDPKYPDAASDSTSTKHPLYTIGLRLSVPLDRNIINSTASGYIQEMQGAELVFNRKATDQENEWKDLLQRLADTQERLKVVMELEDAQKLKFNAERKRMQEGRSTTYQIFLFEQDFLNAQLGRIQAMAQVLDVLTNMKAYEETKL